MSARALTVWLGTALGFLYPDGCQLCRVETAGRAEGYVCDRCRRRVRTINAPFCRRCGLPYEGDISSEFECTNCRDLEFHFRCARAAAASGDLIWDALHRYKYRNALWFEPFLANLLVQQAAPVLPAANWDFIVPVPLHPARHRERGFNQAERLAGHLSRATRIPVHSRLLRRIANTETQTHFNRQQRADNMRNAFALRGSPTLDGARIVLFDDVFTTGATTSACARVLRSAGAADVCVWTVVRGL